MSLQDLQENISHLFKGELEAFSKWFEEFLADQWDKEIEQDAAAGRLDKIIAQVEADYAAGLCTAL